jgi:hypothetical protein
MGSVAFSPVKNDMLGNIKVRPLDKHNYLFPSTSLHERESLKHAKCDRNSENANLLPLSTRRPCKTWSSTSSRPSPTRQPRASSG